MPVIVPRWRARDQGPRSPLRGSVRPCEWRGRAGWRRPGPPSSRPAAAQGLLDSAVTARVLDRLRQGPAVDERLAHLTDQEQRVLELMAEGLTNRAIGERLHLAEKTVKNYVTNVLAKMGMSRRTEAAVYAARHQARPT